MRGATSIGLGLLAVLVLGLLPRESAALSLDWVTVGAPGNPADPQRQGDFGAVDRVYRIGRYEVTNAEYAEFLNAVAATDPNGLYSAEMASGAGGITRSGSEGSYAYAPIAGRERKPVVYVSWYDALRFSNWLHHGQPAGAQGPTTTESGAYTLTGPTEVLGGRSLGARVFLPDNDEWYKAAYYDAGLGTYFDYPAGSNAMTGCAAPAADTGNTGNCDLALGDATDVGAYGLSASPSGTFDQGGNVAEWLETGGDFRVLLGGDWRSNRFELGAATRATLRPNSEQGFDGFRVASSVPEPGTALLLMAGLLGVTAARRGQTGSAPARG